MESDFQTKIDSFDAPLKFTENILSSFNTLSIDPTAALSIGDVECSGTLRVDTIQKKTSDHIQVNSNLSVAGNLFTNGNLDVDLDISCRKLTMTAFHPVKPWVSCLITTSASNVVSLFNYGFCELTVANITRVGTGNKAYTITFPSIHPNLANFAVMAVPYTGSSTSWDTTNNTDYICTTKVENSNSLSVWCRRPGVSAAFGIISGNFYVYTVP
jgi:hypothetical protein